MKVKLSIINDEFTHGYQYDLKDPLEKEWGKESRKDLAIFMNYCIDNYDNDKKYELIDVENVDDVIKKFFDYVVNDKFEFFIRLRSDQITDIIKNFGSDNIGLSFSIQWEDGIMNLTIYT